MPMNLTLLYAGYCIVAFLFSFLINGLFLRFSKNLGTRDTELGQGQVRWSSASKPSLGGISFFITFLLSVISYSIFFEQAAIFHENNRCHWRG
jgi:UDP-GlcNAc:undecaprenyl-phosphate GlcNAc-1-phosphate transferase